MEIYEREKQIRKINGLNPDELQEAMQAYTNKIKTEVLSEVEDTFDIRFALAEELIPYFCHAIDLAMTKGMELAADPELLIEYYEEYKGQKVDKITKYEFEEGKGVSGVLLPNGVFIPCGNTEHHLITEQVAKGQEFGCIYFSSRLCGQDDGVLSYSPIGFLGVSDAQNRWLELNKCFFDPGQVEMYRIKIQQGLE